jgi:hypothetical protein
MIPLDLGPCVYLAPVASSQSMDCAGLSGVQTSPEVYL